MVSTSNVLNAVSSDTKMITIKSDGWKNMAPNDALFVEEYPYNQVCCQITEMGMSVLTAKQNMHMMKIPVGLTFTHCPGHFDPNSIIGVQKQ